LNLKVIQDDNIYNIKVNKSENIYDILVKNNISINAFCGGNGNCGKCKIKVENGFILINEKDRKFFDDASLFEGYRLACSSYIIEDTTISLESIKPFNVVDSYEKSCNLSCSESTSYNIIIDIGTTTVCIQLIDNNANVVKSIVIINPQFSYGADVISRISQANSGKLNLLSSLIKKCIFDGINKIINEYDNIIIDNIYIAANTVMIYLLLNMDCSCLGVYPFSITTTKIQKFCFYDIFNSNILNCKVTILPCISAFVGADIVSGGIMCDILKNKNSILIDIGTNGEILLNANGVVYCASAAAGPAFEGGNISNGIGSVEGAISTVKYNSGVFEISTIGGKKPIGICGSGIVDAIACFIENGIVDKTGLINEKFFEKGIYITNNISVTQNDIRSFQMAKSAIRAGTESVIKKGGLEIKDIDNVFISGGFGFYINIENAIVTGLIPKEFSKKIKIIGNSSLGGLIKIVKENCIYKAEKIIQNSNVLNLANDDNFNELFIKYTDF